jgi:putative flippase GtrA
MQRWIAFMSVGLLGIVIQLGALAVLSGGLGLNYLLATGLAVEAAVLHNFVWHETWTWSDRSRRDKAGVWRRLARFQAANGALSLLGNIVLMRFFVGALAWDETLANVLAIALCSTPNFLASDMLVFRSAACQRLLP